MRFNEITNFFSNFLSKGGIITGLNKSYLTNRFYLSLPSSFSIYFLVDLRKECFRQYKEFSSNNVIITPGMTLWTKFLDEEKADCSSEFAGPEKKWGRFCFNISGQVWVAVVSDILYPEMLWDFVPEKEPEWKKVQIKNNSLCVEGKLNLKKILQDENYIYYFQLKENVNVIWAPEGNFYLSKKFFQNYTLEEIFIRFNIESEKIYYKREIDQSLIRWKSGPLGVIKNFEIFVI